ncbi:MAG: undecaprenyl/decaprenyl-phosphate alpha-N-acetylglucosaminyl 1-phosphate transferase [Lentimicrobiaceae bacterium]|nr:undecaprenyl/decaprenyl-phosphate alpha-N-acetylglucosaminyl 1-phosphate transferase [Lentimicrobiaceae bacterium]
MNNYLLFTFFIFFISTITAYITIPWVIKFAYSRNYVCTPHDSFVDVPGKIRKKSHDYSIPVIGGLVIIFPFFISMIVMWLFRHSYFSDSVLLFRFYALFISTIIISIIGYIDDIKKVSYLKRLILETIVISVMLFLTVKDSVYIIPLLGPHKIGYIELFILLIWCVGLLNSINLIDGLDGLATGIMIIATLFFSFTTTIEAFLITLVLMSVLASCIAFLSFNFYPAKLFLGSSGTLVLGYLLSILTVWSPVPKIENYYFQYAIFFFALPITDMLIVFSVRLFHGMNPFTADSWHVHDRVLLTGIPRKYATILLWTISGLCGLCGYCAFKAVFSYHLAILFVIILLSIFYTVIIINKKKYI